MEYNILKHIKDESDLLEYEKYLTENFNSDQKTIKDTEQVVNSVTPYREKYPTRTTGQSIIPSYRSSPVYFQGYLKNNIGKLVKVESLLGDRLESRIGILLDVGSDYIVLKLYKSCCSMMIRSSSVKYITIAHDNDMNKIILQGETF